MGNKIADLVWLGHKHTKVLLPCEPVLDVNKNGEVIERPRAGIITGAYLNTFHQYDAMKKGYNISFVEEKQRGLQSTGGAIVRHTIFNGEICQKFLL